jgi:hypothetical protein
VCRFVIFTLVQLLVTTAPVVTFDCAAVNRQTFEQQLAVELQNASLDETEVAVTCDDASVARVFAVSKSRREARIDFSKVPAVALIRTLSLATVEVVFAAQRGDAPVTPSTQSVQKDDSVTLTRSPQQMPRWWIRAGGGFEVGSQLLARGELFANACTFDWLSIGVGASFARRSNSFAQGVVSTTSVDVAAVLQALLERDWFVLLAGAGVRVGNVWLEGRANEGLVGGALDAVRVAPVLVAGAHAKFLKRLTLGIDFTAGWNSRSIVGLVEDQPALTVQGGFVVANAMFGVRW